MSKHSFDGPIKGYAVKEIVKNLWRFPSGTEIDEVISEAYLVFARLAKRYPDVEDKHFMALFKTALTNQLHDLSGRRKSDRVEVLSIDAHAERLGHAVDLVGDLENDGYLHVLIRQAPAEVKQVLTLFLTAPTELLEMALAGWKRCGHKEAGGNAQVAQWLGMEAGSRPLDAVRDYFQG